MKFGIHKKLFIFSILLLAAFCSTLTASAQKRDNMTDKEDLLIRDAQEMDERMSVFVKIIERRFQALNNPSDAQSKESDKDFNKWGELRTGTHVDLLSDIQKTLEEAIGKIDDVADHDQKNPLFSKGVRILAKGCERFMPQLKTLQGNTTDPQELKYISDSIEDCTEVTDAVGKLPKEEPKDDKGDKNDKKKKS